MMMHGSDRRKVQDDSTAAPRAARYARIERAAGNAGPGRKEMAVTRRPRAEDTALRTERFLDLKRRGDVA